MIRCFHFQALILNFQKEIALAENIAKTMRVRAGLFVFLGEERVSHFAAKAGRKRDQALAVLGEKLVIHARLVIKAVKITRRNKLDEIPVALVVLAEKDQMIRALGLGAAVLVVIRRDINLAADDRLHAVRDRLMVKGRSGKKIPVIRDGDRGHSAPRGLGGQFADFTSSIEKGVIRVQMQVDKVRGCHAATILNQLRQIGNRQSAKAKMSPSWLSGLAEPESPSRMNLWNYCDCAEGNGSGSLP